MTALALLVLLLLWSKKTPTAPPPTAPPTAPPATKPPATTAPVPWPQVVPPGLPDFPIGWEPDEPPNAAVVSRASQLLPVLWSYGEGTKKIEMTAGRWTTYQARMMGTKRGVVAWRVRPEYLPSGPVPMPSTPPPGGEPLPGAPPPPVPPAIVTNPGGPSVALPTLRQGSSGPSVVALQKRLGVPADGKFGPSTRAAVIAFQRSRGLTPDGVVGRNTWIALTTAAAA